MSANWIAVSGLVVDIIGVCLLAKADLFNRRSHALHQKSGGPNLVGIYDSVKTNTVYEQSADEIAAQDHDAKANPSGDLKDGRIAMFILVLGFALQLISQFVPI